MEVVSGAAIRKRSRSSKRATCQASRADAQGRFSVGQLFRAGRAILFTNPPRDGFGLSGAGVWEDHGKLISPVPRRHVRAAELTADR